MSLEPSVNRTGSAQDEGGSEGWVAVGLIYTVGYNACPSQSPITEVELINYLQAYKILTWMVSCF